MDYRMLGDILPAVEVRPRAEEAVYTQSGGMVWMSDGFTSDSNVKGGLVKRLGRIFSGESLFMATYTASRPDSIIAFASTMPGKILAVDVVKTGLIYQRGTFLCAQTTVEINAVLTKKFTAGSFDGEGFTLQQTQGSGMASLEVDGGVVERVFASGEVIRVDTGSVFVFEPSVSYETETMKGVKSILFGGGGLFLTKLTGPGKVYIQTMNIAEFTGRIAQGLPISK